MPAVPPPLYALGAGFLQHVLAPDRGPGPARVAAAAVAGSASLWLLGGSLARFRQHHTTFEPFDPSKATTLVTTGPNAITRNPMYLGMAGVLTAHALLRGGRLTLLPIAGFVAVIDRLQIRPEEAALRATFGDEYADYCRRVPRWIAPPGRTPRGSDN